MNYTKGIIVVLLVTISGCAIFQRLNMQDIKATEYLYKSYKIDKSIKQVDKILYDYSTRCRPLPNLEVDPATQKTAFMAWKLYVTDNPTIIGLVEFVEKADGTTTAKAYWYYKSDGKLSDKVVAIIKDSSDCQDLY